jgi:2-dehydro-3-deoxyglucarate aldolase/4-hydroxy-2-oxoheptanedioate aldolase
VSKSLRQIVSDPGLAVASSVFEFATPGIGHILKAAGCDFVFLDMEHSGFGIGTMKSLLRYCEAADLPALVRPPSKSGHHIARVLDAGADGLMLPMVGSAEEARRIVAAMKFTPQGQRGVALGIAHDRYAAGPVMDKLTAANERTVCIALIETREGVDNVEEIAAVEGLDGLWIGHFDLSCSLGIPGQFDHPDFLAAVERTVAAGRQHGLGLGRLVATVDEGAEMYAAGFNLICYGGDVWLLQGAVQDGLAALRQRCR